MGELPGDGDGEEGDHWGVGDGAGDEPGFGPENALTVAAGAGAVTEDWMLAGVPIVVPCSHAGPARLTGFRRGISGF